MLIRKLKNLHLNKNQVITIGLVFVVILITILFRIYLPNDMNKLKGSVNETTNNNYLFKVTAIDYGHKTGGDAVLVESNGQYLLMDTGGPNVAVGEEDNGAAIINYLKSNNITTFDIYISHYDADHNYYIRNLLADNSFTIKNIYLPYIGETKNSCINFNMRNFNKEDITDIVYNMSDSEYELYYNFISNLCGSSFRKCPSGKEDSCLTQPNEFGGVHEQRQIEKNSDGSPKRDSNGNYIYSKDSNGNYIIVKNFQGSNIYGGYLHKLHERGVIDESQNVIYLSDQEGLDDTFGGLTSNKVKIGNATLTVLYQGVNSEKGTLNYYKKIDNGNNANIPPYDYYQNALKSSGERTNSYNSRYANNMSLVSMITAGKRKFFTAGDIQYEVEKELVNSGKNIKADVMKLNHHSLATSNTQEFLSQVNPIYAFYQIEYDTETDTNSYIYQTDVNQYSDPSNPSYQIYLWRRNLYNAQFNINGIYSIGYNGNVTFTFYKNDIDVNVEKNYKTVTINYKNNSTNELIKTKKLKVNTASYNLIYRPLTGYTYASGLEDATRQKYTQNVTYNAYYNPKQVEVTFNKNDGTDKTASQTFTSGITNQAFGKNTDGSYIWGNSGDFGGWSKNGYILIGWATEPDATSSKYDGAYYDVDDYFIGTTSPNINLYAVWKKQLVVTYHKNYGSTDKTASQTFIQGIANQAFGKNTDGSYIWGNSGQFGNWDRDEYKLVGWAINSTDTSPLYTIYYGVTNAFINKYDNEIDLYAVWKKIVDVPTCNDKEYSGTEQTLFSAHTSGNYTNNVLKGTNVGTYTTTVKLSDDVIWNPNVYDTNDQYTDKQVTCKIVKVTPQISLQEKSDTYNGSPISANQAELIPDVGDVTYTYYSTNNCNGAGTTTVPTDAGNYSVKASVSATSNINSVESACVKHTINKYSIQNATISQISDQTYTGSEVTPEITITALNKELVKDNDYTLEYSNNINSGTAVITITGIGNYSGAIVKSFNILAPDMSSFNLKEDTFVILNKNSTKKTITDVLNVDVQIISDGIIITNNTTKLSTGDSLMVGSDAYTIVILGDTNKDSKIDVSDFTRLYKIYKKTYTPNTAERLSADTTGDNKINISDFTRLYKIYKGN